jgi:putative transposase
MTVARSIALGEHYHVFNRGAHKTNLFRDEKDWIRFLFLLLYCQSPVRVTNSYRFMRSSALERGFSVPEKQEKDVIAKRLVELVSFCVMPNHFHLIVHEKEEGGIAQYLQRVSIGYTAYFNEKYKASGHVFQGRYKAVHVEDNDQLLYLSAYIHRNPRELSKWKGQEEKFPFSSFSDLAGENRWGELLIPGIITGQFDGTKQSNYRDFVNTSSAKLIEEKVDEASLALA